MSRQGMGQGTKHWQHRVTIFSRTWIHKDICTSTNLGSVAFAVCQHGQTPCPANGFMFCSLQHPVCLDGHCKRNRHRDKHENLRASFPSRHFPQEAGLNLSSSS